MAGYEFPEDAEQLLIPSDFSGLGGSVQPRPGVDDDFTEDEQPLGLTVPVAQVKEPLEHKRRWQLAGALLAVVVVLTLGVLGTAVWGSEEAWTRVSSQVGFLMTPFHTLMGIAVGYYFAQQRRPS